MKKLILLFPLLGALTVLGIQHRQVQQLRAENTSLMSDKQEADQLRTNLAQNAALPSQQTLEDEIGQLRSENRDLLKLRNEFGALSEQKPEYERLKAENQRLLSEATKNAPVRTEFSMAPIYITKENLIQVGLLTPEATIQTFYWAEREEDTATFSNCLVPERQESQNVMDAYAHWSFGLRDILAIEIVARRPIGPDTIQLGVQLYRSSDRDHPKKILIKLKLVGSEWKLDADPRTL